MEIQLRDRPDGLDEAILRYLQSAQNGATIPEIHRAVCPRQREPLVRYRGGDLKRGRTTQTDPGFRADSRIPRRWRAACHEERSPMA